MISLDENNFKKEISLDEVWIVKFWASWCSPCLKTDYLLELESETSIKIGRVNVDENPELSSEYSVVLPTYVVFKKGLPVKKLIGLQTKYSLEEAAK